MEFDGTEYNEAGDLSKIINEIELLCFKAWQMLPTPKETYTQWYYGKNGFFDAINEKLVGF